MVHQGRRVLTHSDLYWWWWLATPRGYGWFVMICANKAWLVCACAVPPTAKPTVSWAAGERVSWDETSGCQPQTEATLCIYPRFWFICFTRTIAEAGDQTKNEEWWETAVQRPSRSGSFVPADRWFLGAFSHWTHERSWIMLHGCQHPRLQLLTQPSKIPSIVNGQQAEYW